MNTTLSPSVHGKLRSLASGLLVFSLGWLASVALLAPLPAAAQEVLLTYPDGSIAWIQGELGSARLPRVPEEPDDDFYQQSYLALEDALRDVLAEYFGATGEEPLELASMNARQLQGVNIADLHLRQSMSGLPVLGSAFRVRVELDTGVIRDVHGRFYPWKAEYDPGSIPQLPFEDAFTQALDQLEVTGDALEDPELVFFADSSQLVLAYRVLVSLSTGSAPEYLYIGASDGRALTLEATELTAPPTGPGSSSSYPWPPIHSTQKFWSYTGSVAASNLLCSTNLHFPVPGYLSLPTSACTPDASVARAHGSAIDVYRFFREEESWKSYDGQGATLVSVANDPTAVAHWSKLYKRMHYGDGDGFNFFDLTLGFDVAAHEISHGVTQTRNNLVYAKEPGALNEAFSDIFAAAAEYWKDGGFTSGTFLVGEDVAGPGLGTALRYMHDPSLDGKSADYYPDRVCPSSSCMPVGGPLYPDCVGPTNDYCGVHYNSGIANLAFYLLVAGGTHPQGKTTVVVPGIGMDKARSVFFEAHGMLNPQSDFQELRTATEQAAAALYDAATVDAVSKCWSAVGVDP